MPDDLEQIIARTLGDLAEPMQVSPDLGLRLQSLLAGLDQSDQELAALLRAALTFRGSANAVQAATVAGRAIGTQQGRKAAGLPKRGRGSELRTEHMGLDHPLIAVALQVETGSMIEAEALIWAEKYYGSDERTLRKHLARAQDHVKGLATLVNMAGKSNK